MVGQKSGTVWALDRDNDGAVLWSTQVGKGGALGGIHWGMATDGRYAYAPNSDRGVIVVDVNCVTKSFATTPRVPERLPPSQTG